MKWYGGILLFGFSVVEMWVPGWNGMLFDPTPVTPEGSKIMQSVYLTGAVVLAFMPDYKKGR